MRQRSGRLWLVRAWAAATHSRLAACKLHAALVKAGFHAPYVLVGHSLGADVTRLFTSQYSPEIAGLVLVDPGIYALPSLPPKLTTNQDASFIRAAPVMAALV